MKKQNLLACFLLAANALFGQTQKLFTLPSDQIFYYQKAIEVNGKFVFQTYSNSAFESYLIGSDGQSPTFQVLDSNWASYHHYQFPTLLKGSAYFLTHNNKTTLTFRLVKTDGTAAGTSVLLELPGFCQNAPYIGCSSGYYSERQWMAASDNYVWFAVYRGANNIAQIWRTDGTAAGTKMVKQLKFEFGKTETLIDFATYGDNLYFSYRDPNENRRTLWRSDGTAAGTVPLTWGGGNPASLGDLGIFKKVGDEFFMVTSGLGLTFWKSTSSPENAAPLWVYPQPGFASENFEILESEGPDLYLNLFGFHKLYRYNRNTESADLVLSSQGYVNELTYAAGRVYFEIENSPDSGREIWQTDGTAAGTQLVTDLCPGVGDWFPQTKCLVGTDSALFFIGSNCEFDVRVFKLRPGSPTLTEPYNPLSFHFTALESLVKTNDGLYFFGKLDSDGGSWSFWKIAQQGVFSGTETPVREKWGFSPNPLQPGERLNFSFPELSGEMPEIEVFSPSGQKVAAFQANGDTRLDLPEGVYFLSLRGRIAEPKKLVLLRR